MKGIPREEVQRLLGATCSLSACALAMAAHPLTAMERNEVEKIVLACDTLAGYFDARLVLLPTSSSTEGKSRKRNLR